MFNRIFSILKNKVTLALIAFIVWMLFFDRNDLSSQLNYINQRDNLKKEKVFYEKEILDIEKNLQELSSDPKMLEKFAREKYLMKKEDEDLYIIVD